MAESKYKNIDKQQSFKLRVFGTVQGVGFRPTIYSYARANCLTGYIKNCGDHVEIVAQGKKDKLAWWLANIPNNIPIHARIQKIEQLEILPVDTSEFTIKESSGNKFSNIPIPPDFKVCKECLIEFNDPADHRFLYPFIACSNCGPRYSLIEKLPYDRKNTSMKNFPFCSDCEKEYFDPESRRFHTENFACPKCGPKLWLADKNGQEIKTASPIDLINKITKRLKDGEIIGMKGLGGFQLICDGKNSKAISKLRDRKKRPHQGLAVMVRDSSLLTESSDIIKKMENASSPIVIVENDYGLPIGEISPDSNTLGIFLPTTPMHLYLFGAKRVDNPLNFLIVTSGNSHGEPMFNKNNQAVAGLLNIVDCLILNNRPILRPVDDSVIFGKSGMIARRARGFAPKKTRVDIDLTSSLAMGGDFKNIFALACKNSAYLSPHVGDLFKPSAYEHYVNSIEDFLNFLKIHPKIIFIDKHPDYLSSSYGKNLAKKLNIPTIEIQHHRAHGASVMAEHGIKQAIAICFDGTGFGDDGTLWGGECFAMDFNSLNFKRLSTLKSSKLLGGEKAITSPKRQAIARVLEINQNLPNSLNDETLENLWYSDYAFPKTSSVGRLFDAVSALLFQQYQHISYEGQAAIGLEKMARKAIKKEKRYRITWNDEKINTKELFAQIYTDYLNNQDPVEIAFSFHYGIAEIVKAMAINARQKTDFDKLCLAGGVFSNQTLIHLVKEVFKNEKFELFWPRNLPAGDGGIALGQLVLGNLKNA